METYPQSEANSKQRRQYSGEGSGREARGATAAPNNTRKKIIFFLDFFSFFLFSSFFPFFSNLFFLFSLKYQNSLTDGFQRVFKGLWLDTAADWSAVTEYLASECVHMFLCVHSYWSFPWEGKVHLGFFFLPHIYLFSSVLTQIVQHWVWHLWSVCLSVFLFFCPT